MQPKRWGRVRTAPSPGPVVPADHPPIPQQIWRKTSVCLPGSFVFWVLGTW